MRDREAHQSVYGAAPEGITQLLLKWSGGDSSAREELMPLVFGELRRLAARYLRRERVNHTLQPTALVNEAYLRLVDQRRVDLASPVGDRRIRPGHLERIHRAGAEPDREVRGEIGADPERVRRYAGGLEDWEDAGYPLEGRLVA